MGDPSFGDPVVAKNPFDPPDPPKNVKTTDVTKNSVKLEWEKSHKDGGKPIKGYIIEKKSLLEPTWHRVNRVPIADTSATVEDVIEDEEYEFRVMAVNEAGPSRPSDVTSPPVKIEDPPSQLREIPFVAQNF